MSMVKTFAHHTPTPQALDRIRKVRQAYSDLQKALESLIPTPSRELSIAKTELETSAMWAIKAIVCNDPESKVEGL